MITARSITAYKKWHNTVHAAAQAVAEGQIAYMGLTGQVRSVAFDSEKNLFTAHVNVGTNDLRLPLPVATVINPPFPVEWPTAEVEEVDELGLGAAPGEDEI